jgi:hypothetical protein
VPVTLKAVNTRESLFSHWEGVDSEISGEPEIVLSLDADQSITAVFQARDSELIHYWHFNTLPDGELGPLPTDFSITQDAGLIGYEGESAGYMDGVDDGTLNNSHLGVAGGLGLRVRNPADTRELVLNLPTTGYESVVMKYAVKRTSIGAQLQSILYRTQEDGPWTPVLEEILITLDYQLVEVDFSNIDGVDNNQYFEVKIVFPHESAAAISGNNRFDNISLEGYPVENTFVKRGVEKGFLRMYPVPVDEVLHFESRFEMSIIGIFDLSGRLIYQEQPGTFTHDINVRSLSSGTYLVEVATPAGKVLQKIVIK